MADVVVITGGSAGIGRASARQFAARGCADGFEMGIGWSADGCEE